MICPAEPHDAEAIKAIHTKSVRTLCAGHYPLEVINQWTSGDAHGLKEVILRCPLCLIAKVNDDIAGFASLRSDLSIWHLYVDPDHIGKGIGTSLLLTVEEQLFMIGQPLIRLQATLNSVLFYEKNGYQKIRPGSVLLPNGQAIAIMLMEKMNN